MRAEVDPALSAKYTDDDELLNIIDLVFDYQEANGLLDIDFDDDADSEDDELDVDDLLAYVVRMLRKDKGAKLSPDDAAPFVKAYLNYESTLY